MLRILINHVMHSSLQFDFVEFLVVFFGTFTEISEQSVVLDTTKIRALSIVNEKWKLMLFVCSYNS